MANKPGGLRWGCWVALVIFLGGMAAAIILPSRLARRVSTNEGAAIGDLRSVSSGEAAYQAVNHDLYESRPECLVRPATCVPGYDGPSFLDPNLFAGPSKWGYVRELHGGSRPAPPVPGTSPSSVRGFAVTAVPVAGGEGRSICVDTSGVVCTIEGGTREQLLEHTASDPGIRCAPACLVLK
jgi:hypothetical protein